MNASNNCGSVEASFIVIRSGLEETIVGYSQTSDWSYNHEIVSIYKIYQVKKCNFINCFNCYNFDTLVFKKRQVNKHNYGIDDSVSW